MTPTATVKNGISFFSLGTCALLLLIYVPFSGFPNFFNSINGVVIHRGIGPIHSYLILLLARDILVLFTVAVYFFVLIKKRWPIPRIPGLMLFGAVAAISISLAAYQMSFPVTLVALRTYEYVPMIMVFYACTRCYPNFATKFQAVIIFVCLLEFFVCSFQTVYMPYYEGLTFLGARVIGTFNNPNTIGAVAAFGIYATLFLSNSRFLPRALMVGVNVITLLMAGSRAAILISTVLMSLFILWKTKPKYRLIAVGCALLSFSGLTIVVGQLAGRGAIPPLYEDPRVQIFLETMDSLSIPEFLFGIAGGVRSNTLILLVAKLPQFFVAPQKFVELAESGIISMILQTGIVGFFIFHAMLLHLSVRTKLPGIALFILVALLSLSNVWLEMYPLNLLIFASYGVLLAQARQEKAKLSKLSIAEGRFRNSGSNRVFDSPNHVPAVEGYSLQHQDLAQSPQYCVGQDQYPRSLDEVAG